MMMAQAVLVKLAHRVHDMAACHKLPQPERSLLAQETLDIYSVVANRLGVWCMKAELEDAAFKVLHPDEYESLRRCDHWQPHMDRSHLPTAKLRNVLAASPPEPLCAAW